MIYRVVFLLTLFSILTGCSENKQDIRLTDIADIVAESPREALRRLDSMDYESLSDNDKYFHDFLTIKANDKAYISHTSDSLILRVMNFYSRHHNKSLYPEALYYAGRVYSDMGDYPTALNYFHLSLDNLPTDTNSSELRNRVLSQTGRLLTSLNLFNEAVPYIESALEINRQAKDTASIIFNMQLLGGTYLRAEDYQLAERYLKESLELCTIHSSEFLAARSKMYLAAVMCKTERLDSALHFIRNIPDSVDSNTRNSILAYASDIYLKAGIPDTAYIYAKELISDTVSLHHEIGYQVLLSPELRKFIHPDTIDRYLSDYRDLLETYYDENQSQLAIDQQNFYNYQLHERSKAEAEESNKVLWRWIIGFIFVSAIMVIVILWLKNRNKNHIIELRQALDYIDSLERELKPDKNILIGNATETDGDIPDPEYSISPIPADAATNDTEKVLREKLRNKLMSLYESNDGKPEISSVILQSKPYLTVSDLINAGEAIKENDRLWNELEQIVLQCSPKFRTNLNLLTLGKLTALDLHTALLIKCGIKPSQMTILLGRSNGAIISRRETLCMKVLDRKLGVKVIDGIIRLL